jgi:uncharacterized protein YbcI
MSNYNSIHTGAELDEAIGRVIDGGSIKVQTDTNTTDIADLKGRMTTAEGNITSTASELDTVEGTVTSQGTAITDLQGRMTTAEEALSDTAEEMREVENDVADLDRKIDESPNIINSPDADLDFADDRGYIIMRVTDGHVKTKNFDSSTIESTIEDVVEEKMVEVQPIGIGNDLSNADFRIVDDDGYILAEFSGGHVKTKNFNSEQGRKGYQAVTRFQVQVECENPIPTNWLTPTDINAYTQKKVYSDNVVLKLPTTYTADGTPTKLIIFCKHGGSQITDMSDPINQNVFPYLLHLGYAVMAADGMPDALTAELHLDDTRVVGNYAAISSTKAAYDYVIDNYNIEKDGAFIWGYSQGGMYAQNVIDLSGINFFACAEVAPVCSMRWHQWDLAKNVTIDGVTYSKAARLNIARLFGFPSVATNADLLALEYNQDNVQGYDPWTRNVENPYDGFVQNGSLWYLPNGTDVASITMKKHLQCPLKVWVANNDGTLSPDVTKVFVQAVKNAGQVADMHIYSSGGHSIFSQFTSIGTFTQDGVTYDLYPIALEVAIWFCRFGGYNVDF